MSDYIVTGGANGIGLAAAQAIKDMGHRAYVIDIECGIDVSDTECVKGAFDVMRGNGLSIAGALNCAGICGQRDGLHKLAKEDFLHTIAVNTYGMLLCMQYELELTNGKGTIINLSSMPTFEVGDMPYAYGYVASKFGVSGISLMAAIEFSEARITAVCPTGINTKLHTDLRGDPMGEEPYAIGNALAYALVNKALPTRRVLSQRELFDFVEGMKNAG